MQIVTDTHTHTVISGHAYSTLQENIAAAKAAGIKLLASTEHASSMPGAPHYWYFVNMRVLPRVIDGVGLLRGVEANILNTNGEIDIDDRVADSLDVVIGSFHEPVFPPATAAEHTQALLAAIRSGKINILGHLGNPAFPFDVDAVIKAAAEHHVLVEINNSSFTHSRTGSESQCLRIAEAARDHGAYLTISSDAHASFSIGHYQQAIAIVEQAGFPEERLVSTDARKLLDYLILGGKTQLRELEAFVSQ